MPMRDSGGSVEFGVRITADNEVFINGVKASRDELGKLQDQLKKTGEEGDNTRQKQESLFASIVKGTLSVEVLRRAWDTVSGSIQNVIAVTEAAQQSHARLEAVLQATGGASKQTSESVERLVDQMARLTVFDDRALRDAATTLTTFSEISGKTFERVLKLSADLAATGRGDLQTWITVLAKAGTEPAITIGLLERALGKFSPTLKVAVQNAADMNDKMLAQKLLFDEVAHRVGGTATETYRGLTRQIEGTSKAWDDLKIAMGEKIFDAQSRDASRLETNLRNLKAVLKEDNWFAKLWAALSGGDMKTAGQTGRTIVIPNPAATRNVDPWSSEPGFEAPKGAPEYLTNRQKQQLRDQDLQNLEAYLGVVFQMHSAELNREIAIDDYRHKVGIDTEEQYTRRVGAIREQLARDDLERIQKTLATERERLGMAGAELTRAKGTELPADVLAAEQKVRDVREKIRELTEQERDAQARVADAAGETGRNLAIVEQKRRDSALAIQHDGDDYLRSLTLTTEQMRLQESLIGASPNALKKATIEQDLTNKFLEKEITLRREINFLKDHGGDPSDIKNKEAELERLRIGTRQAIEEQKALVDRNMQGEAAYYANAASMAKSFFSQNTEGYKILDATEKAFHAAEQALALEAFVQKTFFAQSEVALSVEGAAAKAAADAMYTANALMLNEIMGLSIAPVAVANQALGDPYTAWARMAAMAAAMAALGFAVSGGGGGGSADTSKDRQRTQGTGSILGDALKQSDSIARALDTIRSNSNAEMPIFSEMALSLRNIESSMVGVAALIARNLGVALGTDTSGMNLGTSSNVNWADTHRMFLGSVHIPFAQSAFNQIFGTTTRSLADSGIQINPQTVGEARQGFSGSSYADVTSNSRALFGLIRSSSTSHDLTGLPAEVTHQFTMIVDSMVTSIRGAVEILGGNGGAIEQLLNGMRINLQEISLKGLSGDQIQKALEGVFGKMGDDMAAAAMPVILQFEHVGEGAFATLMRVATGVQTAKGALDLLGVSMVDWTSIVNKTGDVAVEIIRDSLMANETIGGTLTGVGLILKGFDGTAQDLATLYRHVLDIRTLMRETGGNPATLNSAMITAGGGLSAFQHALEYFNQNFFSDGERIAAQQRELATSFARLGIAMPTSIEGFRSLVASIDTTTEAGARLYGQVMALAPLFGDTATAFKNSVRSMYEAAANLSSRFGTQYAETIARQAAQHWKDVSKTPWSIDEIFNEIRGLTQGGTGSNPGGFNDALAFVQKLGPEAVEAFQALLTAYGSWQSLLDSASSPVSSFTGAVNDAAAAAARLAQQVLDAKTGIADWLSKTLLGSLSPLSPHEQVGEARRQFEALLKGAQHGDLAAMQGLTGSADTYLQLARQEFGSSSAYIDIFNKVFSQLAGVAAVPDYNSRMLTLQQGLNDAAKAQGLTLQDIKSLLVAIRDNAAGHADDTVDATLAAADRVAGAVTNAALATARR